MAGFTTPEQDRRFHEVADRFDRSVRREVRRSVSRGSPPLSEELRPLALLYLERLERDAVETKRWLGPLWVGIGVMQIVVGILSWIGGSTGIGLGFLVVVGPLSVVNGLLAMKYPAKLCARLKRSRSLLTG